MERLFLYFNFGLKWCVGGGISRQKEELTRLLRRKVAQRDLVMINPICLKFAVQYWKMMLA